MATHLWRELHVRLLVKQGPKTRAVMSGTFEEHLFQAVGETMTAYKQFCKKGSGNEYIMYQSLYKKLNFQGRFFIKLIC